MATLSPVGAWRPWMVWVWAGELTEEAVTARASEIAARGFGGVVVRVGLGCSPSPNSAEFFAVLRAAVGACREAGLRVWIGDDRPVDVGRGSTTAGGALLEEDNGAARSGGAGGRVGREWPGLCGHILRVAVEDLPLPSAPSGASGLENWSLPLTGSELLFAVAVPRAERKMDFSRALPLLPVPAERRGALIARLQDEARSDVRVLSFGTEAGSYIDLFNEQAARAFVHLSLEPLCEGLGAEWEYVEGLWLQSPSLRAAASPVPTSTSGAGDLFFPWSAGFQAEFKARAGYELLEWLPALVADQGDNAARVRQDFWRVAAELERERFLQPVAAWARAHGKSYGGSLAGTQPINSLVAHAGDVWPLLSVLDAPAAQVPGSSGGALDLGRGLQTRLLASIVALRTPHEAAGFASPALPGGEQVLLAPVREQVLVESGRGAGWDAPLSDRVLALNHALRQGATLLVEHAGAQSWRDDAPLKTPPSLLHQPWAQSLPEFCAYAARGGWAMSRGRSGARVALLWPTRSAHAHHHPRGHRLARWVEEDLHATALMLDDLHFEFLFATEELLLEGRIDPVEGARPATWKCGAANHAFEMIVLPSVTALDRALWSKIEAFVEAGGKVACLGLLPRYSERGRDVDQENAISRMVALAVGDVYDAYADFEDSGGQGSLNAGFPMTRDSHAGGRLSCYQPRLNESVRDALLRVRKILKESLSPEFETQAPDILYARRILAPNEELLPPPAISDDAGEASDGGDTSGEAAPTPEAEAESVEDDFSWDRPFDWASSASSTSNARAGGQVLEGSDGGAPGGEQVLAAREEAEWGDDDSMAGWQDVTVRDKRAEAPPARGGEMFWVFNAGESPQRANVRLRPGVGSEADGAALFLPHRIDLWSGEVLPLPVYTRFPADEGGGLSLSLELAGGEAQLLWAQPLAIEGAPGASSTVAASAASSEDVISIGTVAAGVPDFIEASTWTVEAFEGGLARGYASESGAPRMAVRRGGKMLRVDCDAVQVPPPLLLPDAWQAGRTHPNVLALAPWQWQRGRHLPGGGARLFGRDQWATLPDNASPGADATGILTFRTRFEAAQTPGEVFLPLPSLSVPFDVFLNEDLVDVAPAPFGESPPWSEPSWCWFDLGPLVRAGENILSCVVDCRERALSEAHAQTGESWTGGARAAWMARAPVAPRLVGDFGLTGSSALADSAAMVLTSGSWHAQGLPFYTGGIDLRQWVRATPEWNRCRVFFEISECRDAVGLWLNGRHVGTRLGGPLRWDVSRFLIKDSSNEVRLRVWNTAHPFFEPRAEQPPSGLLGPTRFVAYPIVTKLVR